MYDQVTCAINYVKKVNLALVNLESALGNGWEDDLYKLKSKIGTGDHPNLLDCLLFGASKMLTLLKEGQELLDRKDKSDADCEEDGSYKRDNNLMMFGDWHEKESYDQEVQDVLNHLGVKERPRKTSIVCRKKDQPDENVILRVNFKGRKSVLEALSSARNLVGYNRNKVFLDKDRRYSDRLILRAAVKQLRIKIKEEPNYHWVIKDYKVVSLGFRKKRARTSTTERSESDVESKCVGSEFDLNSLYMPVSVNCRSSSLTYDYETLPTLLPAEPEDQSPPSTGTIEHEESTPPAESIEHEETQESSSSTSSVGDWRWEDEPEHIREAFANIQRNIEASTAEIVIHNYTSSSSDDE